MTPEQDHDFAGMLQRVRKAAGADAPTPPGSRELPPPKKVRQDGGLVSLMGLTMIAVLLVGGVSGLASLSTWVARRMVALGASSDAAVVRRRQLQQQRLKRFVVPVDTTISPLQAGRLLHAISRAGHDGPLLQWELPPEPLPAPCCAMPPREGVRLFRARGTWIPAAFATARRGYSAEQRAFLRGTAQNPALPAFRRVARARAADLSGAIWSVPADTQVSWGELPKMSVTGLRIAADANVAAAALDLEAERTGSAEQRLREVISAGFILQAAARSSIEDANAAFLVNTGRVALEALYLALGRTADATFASAKSDPPIPISYANRRVRAHELETTLLRRIRDTTELAGIRWQLLLGPFAFLPCTSVRQALFGASARHRAALAEFHDALVKYPSDERRFSMVVRGVPQMIDPWGFRQSNAGPPEWADVAFAVTRSRQLETCASLFRR